MFGLKRYFSFFNTATFSSHQYYTVSSFCAVNSSSSCIFQNRKCFYFIRFNIAHISRHSVDKYERRSSPGKSTDSTNPEFSIVITGFSRTLYGDQTCYLTGKTIIKAAGRNNNIFGLDRTHGDHHTFLLLLTVTNYHYFIECF